MKAGTVIAVIAATLVATTAHAKSSPQGREAAIWGFAMDRVTRQMDAWFKDGDFPRVIQTLKFQTNLYPDDYEAATNLGWLLESTERPDEALATYIQFRRNNPGDADAAFPEANFYFRKKAYDKVPPLLEKSIRMSPAPHPNAFRILAHSYERMNLLSDSLRIWRMYVAKAPEDGAAKTNLAKVERKIKAGTT